MIRPAEIDAFLALTARRAASREPRGSRIAYISTQTGMAQLWLLENGVERQLTDHPEPVNSLAWSPLGGQILFTSDIGGDERWQFYLLDLDDMSLRALTADPMTVHMWGAWSADGSRICYTANAVSKSDLDLYVMEVASGAVQRFGPHCGYQEALAFTPDGADVMARRSLGAGSDQKLEFVSVETGSRRPVLAAEHRVKFSSVRILRAGGGLAVCDFGGDRMALWRFDAAGQSAGLIYEDPAYDVDAFALSPDQDAVVVLRNAGGWSEPVVLPLSGGAARGLALPFAGVATGVTWPVAGSLLLTLQSPQSPAMVWELPLSGAAPAAPLIGAAIPEALAQGFTTAVEERFASFDGEEIPFFIYTPAGPAPAAGWPSIFIIHGGPEMQWRPDFRADVQWMTSQGIQVIAPNVRGSTGYGRRFHALDDREKRLDAEADVEALRAWLVAAGRIDAGRCGIFGRSYGGWMVMSALTEHPASWTFGINFYGIGNFFTHLLATGPWGRALRVAEYGDPATQGALLTRTSAIFRAEKITAPLFMVHADRDPRVPLTESETIFAVLFGLGKPCEFLRVSHAGHGFLRAEQNARVFRATAEFIAKHL